MRLIWIIAALTAMTLTSGCGNTQSGSGKTIVVWYSWSGNTETVGRYIEELTGGDVFIIEPVEAYPSDYNVCVEVAKAEIDSGRTREIKGSVPDIDSYDIVFIGTPNWWGTVTPPVMEFILKHDLAGKTVVPFVTHGSGGVARCIEDMEKALPDAIVTDGFVIAGNKAGGSKAEVEQWINSLELYKK